VTFPGFLTGISFVNSLPVPSGALSRTFTNDFFFYYLLLPSLPQALPVAMLLPGQSQGPLRRIRPSVLRSAFFGSFLREYVDTAPAAAPAFLLSVSFSWTMGSFHALRHFLQSS